MAVPPGTLWERDPHTEAKHRVIAGYLDAWYPILLQSPHFRSMTVFEGFAGPGEYAGGEDGSPVIAMRLLLERSKLVDLGKPVRFAFLEADSRRADHLRDLIERTFAPLPTNVTCHVKHGRCEEVAVPFLTEIGAWGQPIFANLDPFDAYVPLPLVQRLASNRATEVLITFMTDRLRRFAKIESLPQGDEMFGSTGWRAVRGRPTPKDREAFLVESYRQTLRSAGLDKIAGFKLIDEGGRAFWLMYASRHPTGLRRMKAAMWDVDPIRGFRFRDPRDPQQQAFDLSSAWRPDLTPLRRQIIEYLGHAGRVPLEAVRHFTLLETSYRERDAIGAIRSLLLDGTIGRDPDRGPLDKRTEIWLVSDVGTSLFDA